MGRALMLAAVFAALAGCSKTSTKAFPLSQVELFDCSAQVFGNARCGTYEVWENRAARSGRRIPLNIVVLPARGSERLPDPVFYFDGGPGAGATEAAAPIGRLLGAVNQSRDLVFVDVRGTGGSAPLRCDMPADDDPLQRYFDEFLSDEYVRACLGRQDADVRFYTQPIAMDDIDEVRRALGYDRINLFGSSGGTRQEQLYMRRHGDSVRSAVLHGVHPMDGEMPLGFSRALETGVRWLVAACASDAGCHEAYPALGESWERSKRRFDAGPVEATVRHPRTGREERVRISRGVYADGVRHMLYNLGAARQLPARIQAAAAGDFDEFARAELRQVLLYGRAIAHGFFMSSTCAEDVRFISEEDIRTATEGTFLGDYRVRRQQAACRIWPRGEGVDEAFQQPVKANVPVLVISGEVDVATPMAEAERVTRELPNAKHIVFPNQGHGFANPACASNLIVQFIAAASSERLDTSCVARTPPATFGR
ncbi:MAG TPA: alpha/beta fold hydrolase [Vicinamibacterales bacterium]|nr:alpha/beta fold hydrolase [Vicinamibacterales bacterium]